MIEGRVLRAILGVVAAVLLLSGCEDFDAAMMTMNDELSFADGYYYPDEHHSKAVEGDCPATWEFGRVNNQAYSRVINQGETDASVTVQWSAGSASEHYLEPGESTDFEYRSGSITPDSIDIEC